MTEYRKGQRVKVQFEGVIIKGSEASNYVTVGQLDGQFGLPHGDRVTVHCEMVTRLEPENWPPQVGDVWTANGLEWFARQHLAGGIAAMVPEDGAPAWDVSQFKHLGPVLVRRRGQ
jgi:hypothetical protein